jgi:hypothetical protein
MPGSQWGSPLQYDGGNIPTSGNVPAQGSTPTRSPPDPGTNAANINWQRGTAILGRNSPGIAQTDQGGIMNARAQQEQALGMMQQSAMGNGPSVAQAQTYGNMGANIASMNAASQGRGGPAQAMSTGANAMNNTAMQGGMARSNEQAGLMSMYGQNAAGLNANDVTQYGTDLQQMSRARDIATQQGIMNAQTVYGMNQQQESADLAKQSFQQQGHILDDQARQQAVNNTITGIGIGASVLGTGAAIFG